MKKKPTAPPDQSLTLMIARTKHGDPVWRTNGKGRAFRLDGDGTTKRPLSPFWWWRWWPSTTRWLPEPHLSYTQVAAASSKSKIILRALRNGPVFLDRGFIKGRDRRVLMTKSISRIVLHWMEGCGIVLTREKLKDGRTRIDIDVDATENNNVR